MIPSSDRNFIHKTYSAHFSFAIYWCAAICKVVEFQQNSNIFSFISGNLWPTLHAFNAVSPVWVCICFLLVKIVRVSFQVLSAKTVHSLVNRRIENSTTRKKRRQTTMSILSINLLPKWVLAGSGDQMSRNINWSYDTNFETFFDARHCGDSATLVRAVTIATPPHHMIRL